MITYISVFRCICKYEYDGVFNIFRLKYDFIKYDKCAFKKYDAFETVQRANTLILGHITRIHINIY